MFDKDYIKQHFPLSKHSDRDVIKRFDTPEDFVAWVRTFPEHKQAKDFSREWSGDMTRENYQRYLDYGDPSRMADAQAIFDKVQASGLLAVNEKIWNPSVVGAFPSVPAAIQNLPESMFSRQESDFFDETTPINIYVELCASGGIPAEKLYKRGAVILALVQVLQTVRPVNLFAHCFLGGDDIAAGTVIRIPTAPFDIDRGGFILGHPGFFRSIGYQMSNNLSSKIWEHWPWCNMPETAEYHQSMKHMLGIGPEDIYIEPPFLTNIDYIEKPVEFINKILDKYRDKME